MHGPAPAAELTAPAGYWLAGGRAIGKDARVPTPLTDVLRWQFDLTWSLLDGHLKALRDEEYLWEPSEG